ncbi:cytochrome b [Alteromonas sp. a30]|uniref:cytochrome b n=1 Tax=Alteromonas sp. a30 TaxID=2730917 RepID=UPI0022820695|nr:cytochrome b [Alteromonas sp. a30]MCY7295475.1 cytochrome b [Alteromonas sp. a30]
MLKNNTQGYGLISILIHWISAIAVFTMFGLGLWLEELSYYDEMYRVVPHWHKSIGILLALLVLFRIIWMFSHPAPKPLGSPALAKIAKAGHGILYLILIVLFISGYLISTADGHSIDVFDWFSVPGFGSFVENQEDIAGEIHELLAFGIIGLAVLHALAALKHHFLDRDNTLSRMIKPVRNSDDN